MANTKEFRTVLKEWMGEMEYIAPDRCPDGTPRMGKHETEELFRAGKKLLAEGETFNNGLTDAQEERLKMLAEEAGEIVQCCMKILRHGYNSVGYNNKSDLERELKEFWTVYERMAYQSDLCRLNFHDVGDVWKKKLPFTHYQPETIPVNHPPEKPAPEVKRTHHG